MSAFTFLYASSYAPTGIDPNAATPAAIDPNAPPTFLNPNAAPAPTFFGLIQ
ncbi:MAG: hypothetical protein AB4080_20200 [Trichodesmium sp.]